MDQDKLIIIAKFENDETYCPFCCYYIDCYKIKQHKQSKEHKKYAKKIYDSLSEQDKEIIEIN